MEIDVSYHMNFPRNTSIVSSNCLSNYSIFVVFFFFGAQSVLKLCFSDFFFARLRIIVCADAKNISLILKNRIVLKI